MTLNEKFKQFTRQESWQTENYMANECEHIADEFAIGFAEWCLSSGIYHQLIRTQKINKELLEIYKETL